MQWEKKEQTESVAAASVKVESGNLQYLWKLKEEPCHTLLNFHLFESLL